MKKILAGLVLLLSLLQATAQEKEQSFYADLQFLARGEIRNGGLPKEDAENPSKAAFLLERTRLAMGYLRPHLEVKAVFQHAGIWGDATRGDFNVQEAWVKLHTNGGLFAQVGRQALAYDDERIIGTNDWSVTGTSHDVLRLGYEGHGHKFHAALAWNQNGENTTSGSTYYTGGALPYKTMQLGWYHYDLPVAPLGVSLLFLNIGMQGQSYTGTSGPDNNYMEWQQVFGGYIKYQPKKWSLEASYYRQTGRNENGAKLDAWMASGKGTFTPSDVFGLEAGYDYLSGDNAFPVPGKDVPIGMIYHDVLRAFTPVYGSHHNFYGAMDFFYMQTFVHGFSPGLQNAYITGRVSPAKGLSIDLSYHYLAMATKLQNLGKTLGHEIEFTASWQFWKDANFSIGLSYMHGSENMKALKRVSEEGHLFWGWASLSFTPRVLNWQGGKFGK